MRAAQVVAPPHDRVRAARPPGRRQAEGVRMLAKRGAQVFEHAGNFVGRDALRFGEGAHSFTFSGEAMRLGSVPKR